MQHIFVYILYKNLSNKKELKMSNEKETKSCAVDDQKQTEAHDGK